MLPGLANVHSHAFHRALRGRTQQGRGDFWVFAATPEKKILSTIDLKAPISSTTTAANGTLYISTMTHLYAVTK